MPKDPQTRERNLPRRPVSRPRRRWAKSSSCSCFECGQTHPCVHRRAHGVRVERATVLVRATLGASRLQSYSVPLIVISMGRTYANPPNLALLWCSARGHKREEHCRASHAHARCKSGETHQSAEATESRSPPRPERDAMFSEFVVA